MAPRNTKNLVAALGFVRVPPTEPELQLLHRWLDSWPGVRWIATSMRAEGHALTLKRTPPGWTATLTFTGNTNLPPAAPSGLATMPTPWEAVQWAARQVVERSAA
jgi:hypothetical protein